MLLRSYLIDEVSNLEMEDACKTYQLGCAQGKPYVIACSEKIKKRKRQMHKGITATAGGFTDLKGAFAPR
jgi:uridine phosphorylase